MRKPLQSVGGETEKAIATLPILVPIPVDLKASASAAVAAVRDHRTGGHQRRQERHRAIADVKNASATLTALQLSNIASRRAGGTVEDEDPARAALSGATARLNALPTSDGSADDAVAAVLRERLLAVEVQINDHAARDRSAVLHWLSEVMIEAGRLASFAMEVGRAAGFSIDYSRLPSAPLTGKPTRVDREDLPPELVAMIDRLEELQRIAGPVSRTLAI